ncbi:MAG: sigma 54-interacting transcriptional regulator [Enterocloster bolteae]
MGRRRAGKGSCWPRAFATPARRRKGPFVAINCAALPREPAEGWRAKCLGYVEGAFTGASRGGKMGFFEDCPQGDHFFG